MQTFMAQDRSTEIISMIKWILTSNLSIKNSFSLQDSISAWIVELKFGSEGDYIQVLLLSSISVYFCDYIQINQITTQMLYYRYQDSIVS